MICLVAALWLLSAVAVFGAPVYDDAQGEQDVQQFLEQMFDLDKSYDESLGSNEIATQEFVKPGHSAKVKPEEELKELEDGLTLKAFDKSYDELVGSNEITSEEFVKPEHSAEVKPKEGLKDTETDINLKAFTKSYDESLGSNEITTQEFVKPGHSAKVKPKKVLKEVEADLNLKALNKSYDESLGSNGNKTQEFVKPGHSANTKLEELLKEIEADLNQKALNITFDESMGSPPHSVEIKLEEELPTEQLKATAEVKIELEPLNISYYKETPVKNNTEDVKNEMTIKKSKKFGYPVLSESAKMLTLKKLLAPFAEMELLMKNSWTPKDLIKDRRVISKKWKPVINTKKFVSTEHPDSLLSGEEDPVTFYLLHDPHFFGCNYVPAGPRVPVAEDLMEELFRPTMYPRSTVRNNLRKYHRKYLYRIGKEDNKLRGKSDKDLETTFKCPEENGSFSLAGRCSTYMLCQNGIPRVNRCPPGLHFNPRVNNCDLASKVNCETFETKPFSKLGNTYDNFIGI